MQVCVCLGVITTYRYEDILKQHYMILILRKSELRSVMEKAKARRESSKYKTNTVARKERAVEGSNAVLPLLPMRAPGC